MKKRLILIVSALLMILSLASCGGSGYTVTFESNGGSSVSSQNVEAGGKVSKPTDPTKEGYDFGSWYSDLSLTDEWDFDNDVVNSNITLYASWITYTAKVVYEDGSPVANVAVQWCNDATCFTPVVADDNGVAVNSSLANGKYYVHIMEDSFFPEGYTYDPNAYVATADNKELTITLVAIDEVASGEGTSASPYVINNEGHYIGSIESQSSLLYYAFTPNEIGTYTIESHVMYAQNTNPLDLILGIANDSNYDLSNLEQIDGGADSNNYNFKYTFEVTAANPTIYLVMVRNASSNLTTSNYPVEFYFSIVKD